MMNGDPTVKSAPPLFSSFIFGRRPQWTLVRIIFVVIICFVLFKFVFIPIRVVGISMSPNYVSGRFNLINRLSYRHADPQRGDVVAVRMAGDNVVLLKRVVGLPGERVSIDQGIVFINGTPLDEPYVKEKRSKSWKNHETLLEPDQFLVIGDNRSMPFTYHYYGLAEREQILGKIVF